MSRSALAPAMVLLVCLGACSGLEPFDSRDHLRDRMVQQLGPELGSQIVIPFDLDDEVRDAVGQRVGTVGGERARVDEILSLIFDGLGLEYSMVPTHNAVETWQTRSGNCLSFVNLFVGIARDRNLSPFYVEVEDRQRWSYQDGSVVSRGHIVAGMHIEGSLSTFDFLPYRPKSYRSLKPIDDLVAAAHYYNNLGAEALMADDLTGARRFLQIATELAPGFAKALNNLAVVLLREGDPTAAIEMLERGRSSSPRDVAILTNLARAHQRLGQADQARDLLTLIDDVNQTNPFYFVYRAEMALGEGDLQSALDFLTRALRLDTENPAVHVGLVKVYLELGDVEKARHHVRRAIRLDPTNPEAAEYSGMLEGMGTGQ